MFPYIPTEYPCNMLISNFFVQQKGANHFCTVGSNKIPFFQAYNNVQSKIFMAYLPDGVVVPWWCRFIFRFNFSNSTAFCVYLENCTNFTNSNILGIIRLYPFSHCVSVVRLNIFWLGGEISKVCRIFFCRQNRFDYF